VSVGSVQWALGRQGLDSDEKLALVVVCNWVHPDGMSGANLDLVSYVVGGGESRARALLTKLKKKGFVRFENKSLYVNTGSSPKVPKPKKKKTPEWGKSKDVQEVFDHWAESYVEATGGDEGVRKRLKLTQKRGSSVLARLNEGYSVADLKKAVDGCHSREHNLEGGYLDLELICRNQSKVEQFLNHINTDKFGIITPDLAKRLAEAREAMGELDPVED